MDTTLKKLGYNDQVDQFRKEQGLENYAVGRVVAEHKERYIVRNEEGEFEAEITGNLRFTAKNREDFPAVGDWVALSVYDSEFAIIHRIFPRFSVIKRQEVGHLGEVQIIATNIDCAFLVQSADRDFNINRLERYLTICYSSKVTPVIVISKIDLVSHDQLSAMIESIKTRIRNVKVVAVSNETLDGYEAVKSLIEPGKTYCLLGSSGVGKSSLLNNLSGKTMMRTGEISQNTRKGKHVTTHRELIVLENGGILIDNPGMREVGIADTSGGLEITFDRIDQLAVSCKFKDCTHTNETGCAVINAIEQGEISEALYQNYLKLEREKSHYESTIAERRKREKAFGKIMKNYKNDVKRNNI